MVVEVAVAVAERPAEEKSARQILREMIRVEIEGKRDVRAPDVADAMVQKLDDDTELLAKLGKEMLRSIVYELVLNVLSSYRDPIGGIEALDPKEHRASVGGGGLRSTDSRAALKQRLARLTKRYMDWREHVGDRHVSLLKILPEELDIAIAEREKQYAADGRHIEFLKALRLRQKPGQPLEKAVQSVDEIESLRVLYKVEYDGKDGQD